MRTSRHHTRLRECTLNLILQCSDQACILRNMLSDLKVFHRKLFSLSFQIRLFNFPSAGGLRLSSLHVGSCPPNATDRRVFAVDSGEQLADLGLLRSTEVGLLSSGKVLVSSSFSQRAEVHPSWIAADMAAPRRLTTLSTL